MKVFYPEYYHRFQCLAGACPDSCCKEWTVDVDPVSALKYRQLPGVLGDHLRAVLQDRENGTVMEIEDGRCPMWRRDGLCRIQAELGHGALCQTCREFPRLRHDYGDFVELGLELSCPEAARLIFSHWEDPQEDILPGGEAPEYDRELMKILLEGRRNALELLKNQAYSLPQFLGILLLYGHSLQDWIDGGKSVDLNPAKLLSQAGKFAGSGDLSCIFAFFGRLEILTESWESRLNDASPVLHWDKRLRPLADYLIRRYWLQAVSDYDLVCRVKLIVVACILVSALGGDPVQTAQQFSKEIENNPDNVEAILDGAYTAPALTDVNLFSILLG